MLSYSKIKSFQNCPQQYYLSQILRVEKIDKPSYLIDREFGKAIHSGLASSYMGASDDDAIQVFEQEFKVCLDFGENRAKTVEGGKFLLREYFKKYKELDKMWEVLSVETLDTMRLSEDADEQEAHLDLVARHRQTKEIYFFDHKTTSSISPSYWKGYELDPQISRYTLQVKTKFGECAGGVINALHIKWADKPVLLDEGDAEAEKYSTQETKYSKYYKRDMVYCIGFFCQFERQIFNRTPALMASWLESESEWSQRIAQEQKFPCNFGKLCSWCEYYELCLSGQDKEVLRALYKSKEEGAR